jgi:hypothetical protein
VGLRDRLRGIIGRPSPVAARAPVPPPRATRPLSGHPAIGVRVPVRVREVTPGALVILAGAAPDDVDPEARLVVRAEDALDAAATAEILAARGGRRVSWLDPAA